MENAIYQSGANAFPQWSLLQIKVVFIKAFLRELSRRMKENAHGVKVLYLDWVHLSCLLRPVWLLTLGTFLSQSTSNREGEKPRKTQQSKLSSWPCDRSSGYRFTREMRPGHYLQFRRGIWHPGTSLQFDSYKGNLKKSF